MENSASASSSLEAAALKYDLGRRPQFFSRLDPDDKCTIGIIHLFPSIPLSQIKSQISDDKLHGAVIVGYGGGYMMTHRPALLQTLQTASSESGILMVLVSQSFPREPVRQEMKKMLEKCGIVEGYDMTLPSAVAKLALKTFYKMFSY